MNTDFLNQFSYKRSAELLERIYPLWLKLMAEEPSMYATVEIPAHMYELRIPSSLGWKLRSGHTVIRTGSVETRAFESIDEAVQGFHGFSDGDPERLRSYITQKEACVIVQDIENPEYAAWEKKLISLHDVEE